MSRGILAYDAKSSAATTGGAAPLRVNTPGDSYEREADRVAQQVTAKQTSVAGWSLSKVSMERPLQRECSCGGECEDCKKKEEVLQREAQGGTSPAWAPAAVHEVLSGSGRAMEPKTRGRMESKFGYDFGGVRIYSDAAAARSASAVSANAYTVGNKVVFNQGLYSPESSRGERLLAHELAHVVQQGAGSAAPQLQRQPCGHDGQQTRCGASNGVWTLVDKALDVATKYAIDDLIVEDGLKLLGGPGEWVRQVQSPPNPVKSDAAERGRIDGAKVIESGSLDVEIVEIKPRSPAGGGCLRATTEATGYVNELRLLAPLIVPMSQKLAAVGGLQVEGGRCKYPKAADKKTLEAAGVDFSNSSLVNAWCFYNSLQDRLGRTFTKPFSAVNIRPNADGKPNTAYELPYGVGINCKKTRKNPAGAGARFLLYMVNQKGGVSYGCRDICVEEDQDEKRKEKTTEVTDNDQKKLQNRDKFLDLDVPADPVQPTVPEEKKKDPNQIDVSPTDGDSIHPADDTGEDRPTQLPPQGVTEWDVLKITAGVIGTVATLHQALKVLKNPAEKKLIENLIEEKIEQGLADGASKVARDLDSKNIVKYGTSEGDVVLEGADEALLLAAKNSPRLAGKLGPRALKGLTKAAPIIAIALAANDARAAVSHIRKGGTIELGPSLDDVDLSGDTHVSGGPDGGKKPGGDVKLKDTIVDIQAKSVPDVTGTANIETDKVTIHGEATRDGSPVTVNMQVNLSNTTVTFKSKGIVQDRKVLSTSMNVSDSQIEIDLPPGALDESRKSGETKIIKGAKIKITSLGGGGGTGSGSGSASGPSASAGPSIPPPGTTTPGTLPPGTTAPATPAPPVAGPDREALVKEIQKDDDLRRLYTALTGPGKFAPVDEVLRRFVALKTMLKRRPETVERIIAGLKPGDIADPIKEVIEPIEQALQKESEKLQQGLEQALKPKNPGTLANSGGGSGTNAPTGTASSTGTAGDKKGNGTGGKNDPGAGTGRDPKDASKDTNAGSVDPAKAGSTSGGSKSTSVEFKGIASQLTWPTYAPPEGKTAPSSYTYWVDLNVTVQGVALSYHVPILLTRTENQKAQAGENWRALYNFTAPAGTFANAQGDLPIQFSDAGSGQFTAVLVSHKVDGSK